MQVLQLKHKTKSQHPWGFAVLLPAPRVSHFTCLCLSFLLSKMELIIPAPQGFVIHREEVSMKGRVL